MLLIAAPGLAEAQGRIAGRTITTGGGELSGAQVSVVGTTLSAISDINGDYSIDNVPSGTHTVRAIRIGYQIATAQVNVALNQTATLNLILPQIPGTFTMVSNDPPGTPIPSDSLKLPVPDSAIIQRRQATGLDFNLRSGERGILVLFPPTEVLTLQVAVTTLTPTGQNAHGSLVGSDGAVIGSFVVVVRNNRLTANIRHGLRLFQIRPQMRDNIYLIVEVDQKKLSGMSGDDDEFEREASSLPGEPWYAWRGRIR